VTIGTGNIERAFRPCRVPACIAGADAVLFFGGSFDPPHTGHADLPFRAARARWPGRRVPVIFVPAARSPHKDRDPTPDRHRVEMLRLSLRGRKDWWIWEQELDDAALNPGAPSYWADTWAIARRVFAARDRAFLIGTDQAVSMHRWRRFEEFWTDALVVLRPGGPGPDELARVLAGTGAWSEADIGRWMSRLVRTETVDASSTAIRDVLSDPARRNARIEGLDPGVQKYVLDRGLYTPA
jgi:nicotinate (nicotinamide) nucleotide adenylyltransferase